MFVLTEKRIDNNDDDDDAEVQRVIRPGLVSQLQTHHSGPTVSVSGQQDAAKKNDGLIKIIRF